MYKSPKSVILFLVKITIVINSKIAYNINSLRSRLLCQVVTTEALLVVDALLLLNRMFIRETKASVKK